MLPEICSASAGSGPFLLTQSDMLACRLKKAGSIPRLLMTLCTLLMVWEGIAAKPAGKIALLPLRRFAQAEGANKPSGRSSFSLDTHDCIVAAFDMALAGVYFPLDIHDYIVAAVDMVQSAHAGWKACSRRQWQLLYHCH